MSEIIKEHNNEELESKPRKNHLGKSNLHDEIFQESLKTLAKSRDLLSIHEENYINNMANKYKYIR